MNDLTLTNILDSIHGLANQLSGGDSIAKGLVTVGILTTIGMLGRKIPAKLWRIFLSRFTINLTFADDWVSENRELYLAAGNFVAENQIEKDLRIVRTNISTTDGSKDLDVSVGPSEVSGFFFSKGKPFWYSMSESKEQGAVPKLLRIRGFGRTPESILTAFDARGRVLQTHQKRKFYERRGKDWEVVGGIIDSPPIFIDPDLKEIIDKKVDFFRDNRQWYLDHGISYKLLIILEGPPGTGKSRLARYIADRLGWSLGTIGSPGGLTESIRAATKMNCVVSIPDVDAIGIGSARAGFETASENQPQLSLKDKDGESSDDKPIESNVDDSGADDTSVLNLMRSLRDDGSLLAEALNLFQGDIPLNNSVVVMSTNSIESIDSALTRPSRCDLIAYVGLLKYDSMNLFTKYYYDTQEDLGDEFKEREIRACDLMDSFVCNAFDKAGYIESLDKYTKA